MAKYPREEISYRKLYGKLDLNKDLEIEWPDVPENCEIAIVDEDQPTQIAGEIFTPDEFDEGFCEENGVSMQEFEDIFKKLDQNFISWVFERLDRVQVKKTSRSCEICGKYQCGGEDAPIVCQGCYISAHGSCYGIAEPTTGRWLCRRCIFHYEEAVCKFCNKKSGLLKKTVTNEWGHVVCSLLIPGVSFCNMSVKDPIDDAEAERLEGACSICGGRSTFLVKCAYEGCGVFYHGSCAAQKLYCDIGNGVSYCEEHNPLGRPRKIRSRRSILKGAESYPELTKEVAIREVRKFSVPKKSRYSKIVAKTPRIIKTGLEKYCKAPVFRLVSEYWKDKRKSIGYCFDDLFMFPNHFLRNQLE